MKSNNRAKDWLNQAKDDLLWAKDSHKAGHYAQTCFICQQIGEKALKSVAYFRGASVILGHSITQIANELDINGEAKKASKKLDLYYISARYPDAFPTGHPSEYIQQDQSLEAIKFAELILEIAMKEVV